MEKNGNTPECKLWHGITLIALIVVLGLGISASYAQDAGDQEGQNPRHPLPQPIGAREGTEVAGREQADALVAQGVAYPDRNIPSNLPGIGAGVQPFPTFSGLNIKGAIINTDGPLMLANDTILYGLTDVRVGLINNSGVAGAGGGGQFIAGPQLAVALAADTPADATVAQGSNDYAATKIRFTAPANKNAVITSITLKRTGTGNFTAPALLNVKIMSDDGQVNTAASPLNAQNEFTFSGLTWTIEQAQTEYLTIKANVPTSSVPGNNPASIANFTFSLGIKTLVTQDRVLFTGVPVNGNTFTIGPPPMPDLTFEPGFGFTTENPLDTEQTFFSRTIKNQGTRTVPARPSYTALLSIDYDNDGNDVYEYNLSTVYNSALLPNRSMAISTPFNANPNNPTLLAGTHKVRICADVTNVVVESDENNNCLVMNVTVLAGPKPDLEFAGDSLSIDPPNPVLNEPVTFKATIKNSGTAAAPASTAQLRINLNNDASLDDVAGLSQITTPALAPNETGEISWRDSSALSPPAGKNGTHSFTVCADPANTIRETNDSANCSADSNNLSAPFVFEIKPGPLLIIELAADTPAGGNVEQGTTGVPLTKIKIYGATTNIDQSIIWTMDCPGYTGINAVDTLKLFNTNNGTQIGSLGSFDNATKKANFTIPVVNIEGGGTFLSLQGNIPADAPIGTVCSFGIALNTDITRIAGGNGVARGAPVYGKSFRIVGPPAVYWGSQDLEPYEYWVGKSSTAAPIMLVAGSANTNPGAPDTARVRVTSTTNSTIPLEVTLTETGADTGIFTGSVTLGLPPLDESNSVFEISNDAPCQNDTLTVTYGNATDTVIGKPMTVCVSSKGNSDLDAVPTTSSIDQDLIYFEVKRGIKAASISQVIITKTGTARNDKIINIRLQSKTGSRWGNVPRLRGVNISANGKITFSNVNDPIGNSPGDAKSYRIIGDIIGCAGGNANITLNVTTVTVSDGNIGVFGFPIADTTHQSIPTCTTSAPASAPQENLITLMGSFFMPTAYAHGDAEPIGQTPTPYDPVYIHDDLYVYGNDAREPGNLFLNGTIVAPNADLQVAKLQSTSDLQVLGSAGMVTLDVSANAVIHGDLTVNGNATIDGTLKANAIGAFYLVTGADTVQSNTAAIPHTMYAACEANDVIVSCTGSANSALWNFQGAEINDQKQCEARAYKLAAGVGLQAQSITLKAQAVCFNPNRDNSKPPGAVDL